jgi:Asp-tRNA(Asn)/Glu-tRNA(Gln) amidotransferase C subunit
MYREWMHEERDRADLAEEEIARLRLTDEECSELDGIISDFSEIAEFNEERCHPAYANKARRRAATLRALRVRLGGGK